MTHIDFHVCMVVAAVLGITYQGQEERVGARKLEEGAILVSFLLSIKEEPSSPKLLWFISALARTVFTWLYLALRKCRNSTCFQNCLRPIGIHPLSLTHCCPDQAWLETKERGLPVAWLINCVYHITVSMLLPGSSMASF